MRLAIHKWRTRTAAHKALYDRVAVLSNNRRLRLALQIWKSKLKEKKQAQWRNDMRTRMKTVRENHERKLTQEVWLKWKQSYLSRSADEHFALKTAAKVLKKWRTRLASLDELDAAAEHFVSVREDSSMQRSWQVWRHSLHVVKMERLMADRVTLRVLSEAMNFWKNRMFVTVSTRD